MRPRCTVWSSCKVPMRGFSRLQTRSLGPPVSRAADTATSTSMSSSASARESSRRLWLDRSSSTAARPPARPRGFLDRSSLASAGQCRAAWHTAAQPRGPISFACSERKSRLVALGPSSPAASRSAPTSVRLFLERSRCARNGSGSAKTSEKMSMSWSPRREVKVVSWQPGAWTQKVEWPASADSSSERMTRWFTWRPAASAWA
mmetsp:Transcript_65125/g.146904  ORF Transcript_65125/g.146904 Transcript_65125/m.146904 type:complete len:204 (+) Transcript_65125:679-1290(+)